jgi:hypothetical protein
MKNEYYITQAIKWNESIRNYLYNLIALNSSANDPESIIREIQYINTLNSIADQFSSSKENVFSVLKDEISKFIGVKNEKRVIQTMIKDSKLFFDDSVILKLSGIMGCSPNLKDIISFLFDSENFKNVIQNIGLNTEDIEIDKLFWQLLSKNGLSKIKENYGEDDIWNFLTMLISENAENILCKQFNCMPEDIFDCLFLDISKKDYVIISNEDKNDDSKSLDSLAVAKMKEWLGAIANTYLKNATNYAKEVWNSDIASSGSCMILPILEYYFLQEYNEAIKHIMKLQIPLRNIFPDHEIIDHYHIHSNFRLRTTIETIENENKAIVIEVEIEPQGEWKQVLKLKGSDKMLKSIINEIPKYTDDLNGIGETIHEKILSHKVDPPKNTVRDIINLFLNSDSFELQSACLFWNLKIPDQFNIEEQIQIHEQITLIKDCKTICKSPIELFNAVEETYISSGIKIKID